MLVALPAEVLRHRRGRPCADRRGGAAPIAAIHAVQAELRGQDPDARRAGRQERSKRLVGDLRPWLERELVRLFGRSRLTEAIRSMLKLRDGLVLFLDDGRLELDTNAVERTTARSPSAARTRRSPVPIAAASTGPSSASLIGTCRLTDVNPHAYLTDALERIVGGHPQSRIDDLLPWRYAAPAGV